MDTIEMKQNYSFSTEVKNSFKNTLQAHVFFKIAALLTEGIFGSSVNVIAFKPIYQVYECTKLRRNA